MYTATEVEYAVKHAALIGWGRGVHCGMNTRIDPNAVKDYDLDAMNSAIISELRANGVLLGVEVCNGTATLG